MADVTKEIDNTQKIMIARFDQTDSKIAAVGEKVVVVEQRVGNIEERVQALENKATTVAVVKPEVTTGMNTHIHILPHHVNHPVAPVTVDHGPHLKASDYILVGVSNSHKTALLKTANGAFVEVEIGKLVPGVGIAKEFAMKGQDWTLVTTNGTIEP
jgi:hypothetical protein